MNSLEKTLHERALEVVSRYRRVEADLLDILQKLDDKKVFRSLGYSSLFEYCLKELKFSEAIAFNFIAVSRKAREIPEIKKEIQAGSLSVSKVRKILPVIKKENAGEWLEKAKTLPKEKLEREVAKVSPQVLTPEKAKYVTEKRIRLELGVGEEVYEKLRRVKDILNQRQKRSVSLEEALGAMAELFLGREDPLAKAQRAQVRVEKKEAKPVPGQPGGVAQAKTQPERIPAAIRHAVILRDHGQCSAILPSGERCDQKRWIDHHHVLPRSQGGKHSVENLQLLCFNHHKLQHAS